MRVFELVIAVLATSFLFSLSVRGQDVATNTKSATIEDIIAGLKQTEQGVRTLSVSMTSKISRDFSADPFGDGDTSSNRTTLSEHWHIDSKGRGWNKGTGKSTTIRHDGNTRDLRVEYHATFDGVRGRSLSIETNPKGGTNRRGRLQTSLARRGPSPFEFTTQPEHGPISKILEERQGRIVGEEEWDEHNVIAVEVEPIQKGAEFKSDFLIDRDRGYAVVRRRDLQRTKANQRWAVIRAFDAFGHIEVADGIWLPKIVSMKTYGLPGGDEPMGQLHQSSKTICSAWKVNVEIPKDELTLQFPPGLKVQGMLEAFQAKHKRLKNFFVDPVTTQLQRKLISGKDVVAYASIDVTAFVDVNTHQITPARFDFDALKTRLKEVHDQVDPGTILVHFDFGAIGTDDVMGAFVREPFILICKKAGFQKVRVSGTYHNDDKTWQRPETHETDRADENNLGDDRVSVFAVRTRLSRSLVKGMHCLIELNQPVPVDSKALLDEEAMETIENALAKEEFDGATVSVKAVVGSTRTPLPNAGDLPHMKDDGDIQLAVVKFLRSLGFKDIRLTVQNGFRNYASYYPVAE